MSVKYRQLLAQYIRSAYSKATTLLALQKDYLMRQQWIESFNDFYSSSDVENTFNEQAAELKGRIRPSIPCG